MFESVEEKLGPQPLSVDERAIVPTSGLPATWFDDSFAPGDQVAIPFSVAFGDSIPFADAIEPPQPSPVYIPADAIAVYAPWHRYRDDYGAYIREEPLLALASWLANELAVPFGRIAPHVLRQIARHEQAHFMFEVAAFELEDVSEEWLYPRYVRGNTGPAPPLTDGVAEEIWASWREVEYARRVARKFADLRSYPDLVIRELLTLPPGYSDFEVMKDEPRAVRAAVASLMRPGYERIVSGRWGAPAGREADNMPLYWIGEERSLAGLGGLPRSTGLPSIRRFERWLRMIGAEIEKRGGRGSHRKVRLPNGRTAVYATSAGRLHQAPANQIARALGLANARVLFEYVRDMRPLPT
jgi:hypothetical protein